MDVKDEDFENLDQEFQFESDIRIDEKALDVEWLEQSSLMFRYAREAAKTRRDLDWAKDALEIKRAVLDAAIRGDPEKFGIGKITEAVISNTIVLQSGYQEANKKYLNAKYHADLLARAVNSIEQRKTALENLVRLHGQQYFAGPIEPRDLGHEARTRHDSKKSDDKVKKAMRRKRSKTSE